MRFDIVAKRLLTRVVRNRGRILSIAVTLLTAVAVGACGDEYPQSTVNPTTEFGRITHDLYTGIFWWTMVILVVVWAVMAYTLIRFREKPGQPHPKQIHGNMALEVGWTIAPALIVVAITVPTIRGVFDLQRPNGDDALVVEVTGHRYWWSFHYPEYGVTTANELHLPVGRPVTLRLEASDVIHSFWVPRIGGKRDVNPIVRTPEGEGMKYTWLFFTLEEEGEYLGQCAEFCGQSHSLMRMRVFGDSPEDFDAWIDAWQTPSPTALAPQAEAAEGEEGTPGEGDEAEEVAQVVAAEEDPLVTLGRDVFLRQSFCVACHAVNGTAAAGVLGPNLTRLGARSTIAAGMMENTPENLFRWIRDPQSVKPDARMPGVSYEAGGWPPTDLTDDQVRALAAYLTSLQ
jgi:cytochrome c oxidase subunit 2